MEAAGTDCGIREVRPQAQAQTRSLNGASTGKSPRWRAKPRRPQPPPKGSETTVHRAAGAFEDLVPIPGLC